VDEDRCHRAGAVPAGAFCRNIFIRSFAQAGFASDALGSNLFSVLVRGLLESLSFWLGMMSLTLLALCLYLGSALALRARARSLALAASAASAD